MVRWNIEGNWKFAADNAIGDMYHAAWTHRSAMLAGHLGGNGAQSLAQYAPTREQKGITLLAAYGHGLNADFAEADEVDLGSPLAAWRLDPAVQARLGPVRSRVQRSNMNVFPNLFVNNGSRDLMVRHPRGPEGWRFARRSWSIAMRRKRRGACRSVPPTGISAPPDVRAG